MRYMPLLYVKEGAKLAKHIYDDNERVLLKKGVILKDSLIKHLKNRGVYSVYIDDGFSNEELEDVIKPELRTKAITSVKDTFSHFDEYNKCIFENKNTKKLNALNKEKNEKLDNIKNVSSEIINDILSQKDNIINLIDIKSYDSYTYQHCINVAVLSMVLGVELKLSREELNNLCLGAMLHDIGKTLTPKKILLKNGKLNKDEFEIIKKHSLRGYEYLKDCSTIPGSARIIALQHHEKIDGSGYPNGLDGNDIYKLSKIVSIVDVYDALTSNRPYRKAMSPNEALEYLYGNGNRHFDYDMIKIFANKIIPYPVGSLVKLSNGEIAAVKKVKRNFALRPVVETLTKNNKRVIDLTKETNIVVSNVQYEVPEYLK